MSETGTAVAQADNTKNDLLRFIRKNAFLALGVVVVRNVILRASRLIRTLDLGPMRRMRLMD